MNCIINKLRHSLVLLTITHLGLFCAPSFGDSATIATASNFKPAMTALIHQFETTSTHQIQQINAASGVLFNQIKHGAPFHALLAADSRYPQALETLGKGVPHSRFTYAQGELVLVFAKHQQPAAISADRVIKLLKAQLSNNHKIALANPETAPYGIAAQQTLEHLGLWQLYQQQWVRGANVAQSYQFIASGNVNMGFAARAQVLGSSLSYWPVPDHWYQPIRQQAILLQFGRHNKAAQDFLAFLQTEPAKRIIARSGYRILQ